jgi:hypothetical protein
VRMHALRHNQPPLRQHHFFDLELPPGAIHSGLDTTLFFGPHVNAKTKIICIARSLRALLRFGLCLRRWYLVEVAGGCHKVAAKRNMAAGGTSGIQADIRNWRPRTAEVPLVSCSDGVGRLKLDHDPLLLALARRRRC